MNFQFPFDDREMRELASEFVRRDACDFRLSLKYRVYYRFLRPIVPTFIRRMIQRGTLVEPTGCWYEPALFMNSIVEGLKNGPTTFCPWPDQAQFAFVLTHDVETSEGMGHVARIADQEERRGFRSSWNLVPHKYKIDMGLVKDLQSRGFEIGIHGFNHDGQLYSSRPEFERRAVAINAALRKYGAVGFRSPMVHRNLDWLQSLEIEYDGSCFDIDPFQPAPGGVGSIWPFMAGRFVELPYTLPQDHTLFVALGHTDDHVWRNKLDYLIRHRGMALMLTHPDYLKGRSESDIYFHFLDHARERGEFWHGTPLEIAQWWRARFNGSEDGDLLPLNRTADNRISLTNLDQS